MTTLSSVSPTNWHKSRCYLLDTAFSSEKIKLCSRVARVLHLQPDPQVVDVFPSCWRHRIY